LHPLTGLGLIKEEGGRWFFDQDGDGWVEAVTEFYEWYLAAEAKDPEARWRFAPPEEAAAGLYAFAEFFGMGGLSRAVWVKGQVAGPVSIGLNLLDQEGKPSYYDRRLREMVNKCLAQGISWQVEFLGRLGRRVVIFVDDPGVGAWGTSTYVGLDRRSIIEDLRELVAQVKQSGGMAGAHSCAGVDWSVFLAAGFEILSFDAYGYFKSLLPYVRELKEFLSEGGVLAWGIVPTSAAAAEESPSSLARLWWEEVEELVRRGLAREALLRQSMITPSCGAGILDPKLARRVYELTSATAEEIISRL
jgi:hypothetical protein